MEQIASQLLLEGALHETFCLQVVHGANTHAELLSVGVARMEALFHRRAASA